MRNIKETIKENLVNEGLFGFGKKSWQEVSHALYKKGIMDELSRICKKHDSSPARFVSTKTPKGFFVGFETIYGYDKVIFIPLCKVSKLYAKGGDKVEKEDAKMIASTVDKDFVKLTRSLRDSFDKINSEAELRKRFREVEMQSYSCDSDSKYDSDTRHPDSYDGSNGKVHGGGHIRAYFDDDAAYDAGLR